MSNTLYEEVIKEKKRIIKELSNIEKELRKLPDGELSCNKNGKYVKWYYTNNRAREYIPKSKRAFAQQLAKRKYFAAMKKDLENELRMLKKFENNKSISSNNHMKLLENPDYVDLLGTCIKPKEELWRQWMKEDFEKNTYQPENLIHDVGDGLMVRSKAEAMIVSILRKYGIPFRYECACLLRNEKVFPDFTIIHPRTGNVLLWEHCGMMSELNYYTETYKKLKKYNDAGWVMGINLIVTTETKEHPLDYTTIENRIKEFLLN